MASGNSEENRCIGRFPAIPEYNYHPLVQVELVILLDAIGHLAIIQSYLPTFLPQPTLLP